MKSRLATTTAGGCRPASASIKSLLEADLSKRRRSIQSVLRPPILYDKFVYKQVLSLSEGYAFVSRTLQFGESGPPENVSLHWIFYESL